MASKTILVIDADSETEQLIASTLESEGYLVFAVPGGDIGTEMAQKVSPSLIFINPDETGLQMCKTIRGFESLRKVPLVLLTSPMGGTDPGAGAAFGGADVLNVPFTAAELLEKTAKVLDTKAPIVLHVKEKDLVPASEEGAFPDFLDAPVAEQNSDIEAEVPQVFPIPEFDEEPEAGSVVGKEKGPEPTDTYISREPSRRRKKRDNFPAIVAGVVIVIIAVVGALFYLGLIPGMGAKKAISVKPLSTAVKPKAEAPAPPSPVQSPAPANEQQKQQAVAENKTVPAPSPSAGKAASPQSSPTTSAPAGKEPSPAPGAAPATTATVKSSRETVYSVQLGVFKSESNAAALTKEFKGKGYDAFMVKSAGKDKGTLYRVLVGKSADRKESAKLAARVRDEEKIRTIIYAE